MQIRLPWPPAGLQPHAKGHWRPKATATKQYRHAAWVLAKAARVSCDPTAVLRFTYHPPDRRRRDVQNIPGMLKPAIDGIADAMGCDDHKFHPQFPDHFAEPQPEGCIVVEINPAQEKA